MTKLSKADEAAFEAWERCAEDVALIAVVREMAYAMNFAPETCKNAAAFVAGAAWQRTQSHPPKSAKKARRK